MVMDILYFSFSIFSFMKEPIISRRAAFCGESFFLVIIKPPNYVILSYISLEVYTIFGIDPPYKGENRGNIYNPFIFSGLRLCFQPIYTNYYTIYTTFNADSTLAISLFFLSSIT